MDDDEASSVGGHDDDCEEDGGEEEEEEGEVDEAVDKIFVLLEQGQEAQEKILLGVAEQVRGCMIGRLC